MIGRHAERFLVEFDPTLGYPFVHRRGFVIDVIGRVNNWLGFSTHHNEIDANGAER